MIRTGEVSDVARGSVENGPVVYRTLAEQEARSRRHVLSRRDPRTAPAGRIHAAEPAAARTLCDRPTAELHEFGRSRFPFERTPMDQRCLTCDELAGSPTMD